MAGVFRYRGKGSLREVWKRPSGEFAAFLLGLALMPGVIAGGLKSAGFDHPWRSMQFLTESTARYVRTVYEPDLTQRLAASQQQLRATILTSPGDAMLPGGLAYLTDEGIMFQRVDSARAQRYRQENARIGAAIGDSCGMDPREALASCDIQTLYAIMDSFTPMVRERADRTFIEYAAITGELAPGIPMRHKGERRVTLRELAQSDTPQSAQQARRGLANTLGLFLEPQQHEHSFFDEMRAYGARADGTLYGTWEYRGENAVDWENAEREGEDRPHLLIVEDKKHKLRVWQLYGNRDPRDPECFDITPDGRMVLENPECGTAPAQDRATAPLR